MIILKTMGIFLIQPLLWLGIVFTAVIYSLRIKNERADFRIAIDKDWYEIRHFIKKGILYGLLLSLFSLVIGIFLPPSLIFEYELLASLAMVLLPVVDLSSLPLFIVGSSLIVKAPHLAVNGFLLLTCNYFIKTKLVADRESTWFTPQIKKGKRGRRIIEYHWHEFSILPLLIFIPGHEFNNLFGFLPVLKFGQLHFSIFILPLFVGSVGRIFKEQPQIALINYRKQNKILSLGALFAAVLSYLLPQSAFILWGILVVISWGMILWRKALDNNSKQWYVETNSGVRVIAIRPNTPAAKMNLKIGDIILNCNGRPVHNENQFYVALQQNSAYCHLKIKTFNGDLKITEGAIYNDSPYELGIVLFH